MGPSQCDQNFQLPFLIAGLACARHQHLQVVSCPLTAIQIDLKTRALEQDPVPLWSSRTQLQCVRKGLQRIVDPARPAEREGCRTEHPCLCLPIVFWQDGASCVEVAQRLLEGQRGHGTLTREQ